MMPSLSIWDFELPPARPPGDEQMLPGDHVRAEPRTRPPGAGQTGIVTRRRWFGRVSVLWTSGDTTVVRVKNLRHIGGRG